MRCYKCKINLPKDAEFCPNCGEEVDFLQCYTTELLDLRSSLEKKTDLESLDHIVDMAKEIHRKTGKEKDLFDEYMPMLTNILRLYKNVRVAKYRPSIEKKLTRILDKTERAFEIRYEELLDIDANKLEAEMAALDRAISQDGLVDSDFVVEEYSS